jgi:hypothetical protein
VAPIRVLNVRRDEDGHSGVWADDELKRLRELKLG